MLVQKCGLKQYWIDAAGRSVQGVKMKKTVLLILSILLCNCVFAQMCFSELGDRAGLGVVYRENTGNFINLVNIGDGYIMRYRDMSNQKAYAATVNRRL